MGKNLISLDLRRGGEGSSIRRMNIVNRVISIVTLSGLPRRLQVGIYGLVGVAIGMALVLARIANATSYLSDEPQTCINCHVMTDAYASWQRGSHGRVAVCVDCHVPHSSIAAKYAYKAQDGLKHSYVFTMRKEPQVLELSDRAVPVVQANCVQCHSHQLVMVRGEGVSPLDVPGSPRHKGKMPSPRDPTMAKLRLTMPPGGSSERRCWDCHQNIHGEVRSLSASPVPLRPGLPDAGLDWMKEERGHSTFLPEMQPDRTKAEK